MAQKTMTMEVKLTDEGLGLLLEAINDLTRRVEQLERDADKPEIKFT